MFTTVLLLMAALPEPPDTIVVCPKEFVAAMAPWLHHREGQGHRVEIVPPKKTPQELRQVIREAANRGKLKYVLLVGDADPQAQFSSVLARCCIPTHKAPAKVNVQWGSEPEIGTDNWYADLDDDWVPELAIGRLTADNREELSTMVAKIIEYEQSSDFGPWRRRINFVAGVGGFGQLADTVLETATKKFLTEGIPAGYQTSMTYGSWRSPFCPDPRKFHETAVSRLNEGCLFWVYIGHGQRTFLDRIHVPGNAYHILGVNDIPKINHQGRAPIAVFLSCYAGAFDGEKDCLGEELLRSRGGPVSVLCGSRVTMPYAMAIMGNELIGDYFNARSETLGEALLATKRNLATAGDTEQSDHNRQLLDSVAKLMSPDPESLDDERREHLLLFNLLGDPLLRLPRAAPVSVAVPEGVVAGTQVNVTLDTPVGGECLVELVCRRDRTREQVPVREYYDGRDRILSTYEQTYQMANDSTWFQRTVQCAPGKFPVAIDVPYEARGNCHVRAYITGSKQWALGSADVFVRTPKSPGVAGE